MKRLLVLLLCGCAAAPSTAVPGHSHNDYLRRRPLLEAVDAGLCSVEADVFLVEGELRVGHETWMLRPGRTLESMYLDPLREMVAKHGCVVAPGDGFTLLIDIKTGGAALWPQLRDTLERHRSMLTRFRGETVETGAVTVILSGDRPRSLVERDDERLCAIDGRPVDLDRDPPAALVPLISDDWKRHFEWDGFGTMPEDDARALAALCTRAHAQGRRIRFWGAPDTPACWAAQRAAGVDLVNTDRPADLARALR
ncbi:MAG: phosphatidylinositol-specific phospholipase C/glycerophosphodiester phosphodiesterase family protein [Planctomycetota bacterium]